MNAKLIDTVLVTGSLAGSLAALLTRLSGQTVWRFFLLAQLIIIAPLTISAQHLSQNTDADSARMIRHSGDYSTYKTPGSCVSAAMRTAVLLSYKNLSWQPYSPESTYLSDSSRNVARRCAAGLDQYERNESLNAIRLSFILGNDSSAELQANQLLESLGNDTAAITDAISRIIVLSMEALPMRFGFALKWTNKLDSYGKNISPPARFAAHQSLGEYFFRTQSLKELDDEIDYFEKWIREIPAHDRGQFFRYADVLYQWGILSAVFRHSDSTAPGRISDSRERYRNTMVEFYGAMGRSSYEFKAPLLESFDHLLGGDGKVIAPEETTLFKAEKNRSATARAILYWRLDPNCGTGCYGEYAMLRRLDSAYALSGLEIRLVTKTAGYFGGKVSSSPDWEKEKIREYVHQFLGLNHDLYIYSPGFNTLRDGRRVQETDEFALFYRNARLVLLDENYKIKLLGNGHTDGFSFFSVPEHSVSLFIERELNQRP